jgi:hypothetical protein
MGQCRGCAYVCFLLPTRVCSSPPRPASSTAARGASLAWTCRVRGRYWHALQAWEPGGRRFGPAQRSKCQVLDHTPPPAPLPPAGLVIYRARTVRAMATAVDELAAKAEAASRDTLVTAEALGSDDLSDAGNYVAMEPRGMVGAASQTQ